MTKKIPCACAQGYHYSKAQKTKCRRTNSLLLPSTLSVADRQTQRIHHVDCKCEKCQDMRVERLIFYFNLPINRYKLLSQLEISSDQPQVDRSSVDASQSLLIWDENKIKRLMLAGIGDIDSKFITAVKNRKLRIKRNHTFLRMYLFLNPHTLLIVQKQDWMEFVRPHQLMIDEAKPVDCRSYRQRIQEALEKTAKRYKHLCSRSPQLCMRTHLMMDLEDRINYLTEIVQKFNFVEDFDAIIAQKEQQRWEENIIILKKGDHRPNMIEKFSDLKAIAPYLQYPDRKKINLNIIGSKQKLERIHEKTFWEAKYYGLIQKANLERREEELLLELDETYRCQQVQKMEIEPSTPHKSAQKLFMDIEYSGKNIESSTKTNFTAHSTKRYLPGRSYLSPKVVVGGRSMTDLQISISLTCIMKNLRFDLSSTPSKTPTKSTRMEELFVFSDEKSIVDSQKFPIEANIPTSKPNLIEFSPRSDLKMYSLGDMQDFPKMKKGIKFQCLDFRMCSRMNCREWLRGSILQCPVCRAQYHQECWASSCRICEETRTDLPSKFHLEMKSIDRFQQMKRTLTAPPPALSEDDTSMAIMQIEKNLQRQRYCVVNCFNQNFRIPPFHNYQLKRLHSQDQAIIDKYESQTLAFPVLVKDMDQKKGKGLVARRNINKGQVAATYSGNVLSLAEACKLNQESMKSYIFHLISGPEVTTNFVVHPSQWASAGYFMNHGGKEKANVKTFIALHRTGPIVIMQAAKNIKYAQELLYDYNGEHNAYDTRGFE